MTFNHRRWGDWLMGLSLVALAVIAALTGLWTEESPSKPHQDSSNVTILTQPAQPSLPKPQDERPPEARHFLI